MYKMDLCAKVRRAVMVESQSKRATAKRFEISRKIVSTMLQDAEPAGYQHKDALVSPKLGRFIGVVNQLLQDDREVLKKQRHTALRIFERLRDEHGYAGVYTVVRVFVTKERLRQKEVFVPLAPPPLRLLSAESVVPAQRMAILACHTFADGVVIESSGEAKALLIAGQPLSEPIAQYGPFVMNTEQEIYQALNDFRDGRLA